MRPRAGTHPVRLEPSDVVELLALARRHDEMLKEARQDLFRTETKLNIERTWRWPIRAAFLTLGVLGVLAWQNDQIRSGIYGFLNSLFGNLRQSGIETLITLVVGGVALWLVVFLVRRWVRGPTPEQKARKLMEEFARTDGVAAYVFTGDDNAEEEAALVGALTRPEDKRIRKRRLTHENRPLVSSMTRILNPQLEGVSDIRRTPLQETRPIVRGETG